MHEVKEGTEFMRKKIEIRHILEIGERESGCE
jgi:hypothetical protein